MSHIYAEESAEISAVEGPLLSDNGDIGNEDNESPSLSSTPVNSDKGIS